MVSPLALGLGGQVRAVLFVCCGLSHEGLGMRVGIAEGKGGKMGNGEGLGRGLHGEVWGS